MVAIDPRQKSVSSTAAVNTNTTEVSTDLTSSSTPTFISKALSDLEEKQSSAKKITMFTKEKKPHHKEPPIAENKSATSQRDVEIKLTKTLKQDADTQGLAKKVLKLDIKSKELEEYPMKSPKSPSAARLTHQTSLSSSADGVEDRKTLREALYQGIFSRHRRTIFAVGSFLRMLRSRNSQYNTIRSSSEGEEIDEVR